MANKVEFNVLVTGIDQFGKQIQGASKVFDDFGKSAKSLARDLSQVGSTISLVGASISGPLVLAFKNASKTSSEASTQLKRFQSITEDFGAQIARSVTPVIEKFNNILSVLLEKFNSLDQALKDQVIQGSLLVGVLLTVGGAFTVITAKLIGFVSNLSSLIGIAIEFGGALLAFVSANPIILAVAAAIAVVAFLMKDLRSTAKVILNTFEVLFLTLKNGFLGVRAAILEFQSVSLKAIAAVAEGLSKFASPLQEQYKALAGILKNDSVLANRLAFNDLAEVNKNAAEIGKIIKTGEGQFSESFDTMISKALSLKETLANIFSGGSNGAPGESNGFIQGFTDGLNQIGIKINDLKSLGLSFATTLQGGLATAFSDIILGAKNAKEAFADFGRLMLKTLVDYIAQWLAFQILSKALAIAGITFAVAQAGIAAAAWAPAAALASLATLGANSAPAAASLTSTVALANVLAIPKLAQGTGGFKDDTLAMINKKEIVVPAPFSESIRSGDLSLSGGGQGGSGRMVFDFTGATFNAITSDLVEKIFTKASENLTNRTLAFARVA